VGYYQPRPTAPRSTCYLGTPNLFKPPGCIIHMQFRTNALLPCKKPKREGLNGLELEREEKVQQCLTVGKKRSETLIARPIIT